MSPLLGAVTGDCEPGCGEQAQSLFDAKNYRQAVQQLYAYAVAYGFDGWVIDFENNFDPSSDVLQAVKDLAAMKLPDGQPLRVAVYEAHNYNLGCTAPAFFCHDLLPYFQAGAAWQADYTKDTGFPAQTYQDLAKAGLAAQRLRAFWSTDVYRIAPFKTCAATTASQIWNGNGGECLNTAALFDNQRTILGPPGGPQYYTSEGLYAPEWTYFGNLPDKSAGGGPPGGPTNRAHVHAADDALWVGVNVKYSGQSCARTGTANAVSSLIAPRSVVGSLPFVSSFNEGEGDVYAVDGKLVAKVPWNDLSAQDVLPTWFCTLSGNIKFCAGLRERKQRRSLQWRVGACVHRAGRRRGGAVPNADIGSRRTHRGLRDQNEFRTRRLRQALLQRWHHGDGPEHSDRSWLESNGRLRQRSPRQGHRASFGGLRQRIGQHRAR